MVRLEQISTTARANDYLLRFRQSNDSLIELTVTIGQGGAISALPDLLTVGSWRNVNDIVERVLPAVRAFATATAAAIDDQ